MTGGLISLRYLRALIVCSSTTRAYSSREDSFPLHFWLSLPLSQGDTFAASEQSPSHFHPHTPERCKTCQPKTCATCYLEHKHSRISVNLKDIIESDNVLRREGVLERDDQRARERLTGWWRVL